MPKLLRPIPESDHSITRPIAVSLVQEVMMDKMLISRDTPIRFPGYSNTTGQSHKWLSHVRDKDRLPTDNKMTIDITENYVADWMPQNVTTKVEHIPIFLNRELDIEIRPVYASIEMKLNLQYRATSKTEARKWYDYMMLKAPNREDCYYHTLKYSYSLPESYLYILKEIHRLTELRGGYKDDFETFFMKWVNPRYTILTDQTGKNTVGAFAESQIRCLGFFDINNEPDFGSRPDETEAWLVEIPYVLRYEKPKDVYFSYPISIHNTVLSKKYRPTKGHEVVEDLPSSRTWSMGHLKQMEALNSPVLPDHRFPGKFFPIYDDWMPRMVPDSTKRVFTTLVLLPDEKADDPYILMNIKDLEHPQYAMSFNKHMINYLIAEHQFVNTYRNSAAHIGLYIDRLWMDGNWVEMDRHLNVKASKDLNVRKCYHVRLSLVTDLSILIPSAKDRLRMHPEFFEIYLNYIIPEPHPVPKFEVVREWIGKPGKWIGGGYVGGYWLNGVWYQGKWVDGRWVENEYIDYVSQFDFDRITEYLKLKFTNWSWNNDGVGISSMRTVQKTTLNALYG